MKSAYIYLIFSCMLAAALLSCGDKKEATKQAAPPPVFVTVTTVKDTIAGYFEEYPATITA